MSSLWHRTSSFVESNLAKKERTPVLSSGGTLMERAKSPRISTRKKRSNGSFHCVEPGQTP
jgi:hypothetical protein